jgi:glycosyltransferase involved in cell wall biosynthesis
MPDRPVVSVIVPSRYCLAWLLRAIASIGRTPDTEIVILHDGSLDGSRDWLGRAAQSETRLCVLVGPGAGPPKARNMAIGVARGRLLAFLDAEDSWHRGKLEAQLALHRDSPDLVFSFTDYRDVGVDGAALTTGFAAWPWFHNRHAARTDPYVLEDDALAQVFAAHVVATSTVVAGPTWCVGLAASTQPCRQPRTGICGCAWRRVAKLVAYRRSSPTMWFTQSRWPPTCAGG